MSGINQSLCVYEQPEGSIVSRPATVRLQIEIIMRSFFLFFFFFTGLAAAAGRSVFRKHSTSTQDFGAAALCARLYVRLSARCLL